MFEWLNQLFSKEGTDLNGEVGTLMDPEEVSEDINSRKPTSSRSGSVDPVPLYVENDERSHEFLRKYHERDEIPGENPVYLLSESRAIAEEKNEELNTETIERVLNCHDDEPRYIEAAIENEDDSYTCEIETNYEENDEIDLTGRRPGK